MSISVPVTHKTCSPGRLHSLQAEESPIPYTKESIDMVQYNSEVIAIVGTRELTENGLKAAYVFGCEA